MTFGPQALRGAAAAGRTGVVDFRLARNAVVAEYRRGRLSRIDVCDAHPELLRAATHVGRPAPEACPICDEGDLVLVTYVFGGRLPPSGRCISTLAELAKLQRTGRDLTGYQVEVCPACSWNHLARSFPVGRSSGG